MLFFQQKPDAGSDIIEFHWKRGYGAFSVSQSNVESVKLYIQNQEAHHKKFDFQDELRIFLVRHGMIFEEKYLWD